jgi:hypothetical protein
MSALTISGDSRQTEIAENIFMSSTKSKCYFHFKIDLKGLPLEPFRFVVVFIYILDEILP